MLTMPKGTEVKDGLEILIDGGGNVESKNMDDWVTKIKKGEAGRVSGTEHFRRPIRGRHTCFRQQGSVANRIFAAPEIQPRFIVTSK